MDFGGSTNVQSPSTPTPPTTQSSIADWVANYPKVFALQQQYAPQEAEQQLALLQQYGLPMAQAYKTAQEAMYPTETALRNELGAQALEGMNSQMPDWMKQQYRSEFNANLGTNAGSAIGADYVSTNMLNMQKNWQDYYRNLGTSLAGSQPVFQAQSPAYSNYASGFTPNSVMSYNMQGYDSYAPAYASMYGTNASMQQQANALNPLNKISASWSSKNGLGLGYGG